MAGSLDGAHDVVDQTHAVLRPGIKAAHLPVIEACPGAGHSMPCLPQTDLQEGIPTCPSPAFVGQYIGGKALYFAFCCLPVAEMETYTAEVTSSSRPSRPC